MTDESSMGKSTVYYIENEGILYAIDKYTMSLFSKKGDYGLIIPTSPTQAAARKLEHLGLGNLIIYFMANQGYRPLTSEQVDEVFYSAKERETVSPKIDGDSVCDKLDQIIIDFKANRLVSAHQAAGISLMSGAMLDELVKNSNATKKTE